ncbi:MAG: hypothetical protein ABIT37_01755 [Luteolibacter sp.]
MIKKSLITALVFLLVYHFALPHLSRDYYWIAGQQRANYLRAQKFVHDTPADANVIVGSSMANTLSDEMLAGKYEKLTFPAGGSFTGLEIIAGTGKHPKVLWIESNTLLRDADKSMLDDVLSPWRRKLRDTSPVFKEEGRPSNFEVGFFNELVGKICHGFSKITGAPKKPKTAEHVTDPSVFADIMKVNREHLDRAPSETVLTSKVNHLGELIDQLTRSGTTCILFEMPFDSTLKDLAEPMAVRTAMEKRFPSWKYHWFTLDHDHAYQTTDGVHLVKSESDKVTGAMLQEADALK